MGGFFTSILPFAKTLNEFGDKLRLMKKERREAVAVYLEKIAQTIDGAASSLKEGKPPHEECAKLKICAKQLSMDLDCFGPSEELLESYQDFQECMEIELSEASGNLKALADTLRATEMIH